MALAPRPKPHIEALTPYESARSAHTTGVMLDGNEYPDTRFMRLLARVPLNRYPDPRATELRGALAAFLADVAPDVAPDVASDVAPGGAATPEPAQLVVGNGADELIDLIVRAYAGPDNAVLVTPPTYGWYTVVAHMNRVAVREVPLIANAGFALDRSATDRALSDPSLTVAFLCSPNNPTGNLLDRADLLALADAHPETLIVVDEAYIEWTLDDAGRLPASLSTEVAARENLVVLRTFSKAWALAGLRLGYAIGPRPVVETLAKLKPPYNVSVVAAAAARRLLARRLEPEGLDMPVRHLKTVLRAFIPELQARGFAVLPSEANFVAARVPEGVSASALQARLVAEHGIVLRDRSMLPGLADVLRFSAGRPLEHEHLLRALDTLLPKLRA